MKNKKLIIAIIAGLVLLTAILAVIHFNTRDKVPDGALMVNYNGCTKYVELDKLDKTDVVGTIVNGKGEKMEINESGTAISDVLAAAGIDTAEINSVTATASDEFSAELTAAEIAEDGKAYLADDGDNGVKLIVFGDKNSKRNVRDVVKLDVN